MKLTLKSLAAGAVFAVVCSGSAKAVINDVHNYELGEPGSLVNGLPQDSVGSAHFTISRGNFGVSSTNPSPVSSMYVTNPVGSDGVGWANWFNVARDNVAIEIWVRTSDVSQTTDFLRTGTDNNNELRIGLNNGVWRASYHNAGSIGAVDGAGQTAVANTWTHLAVIRDNGISTFYIDGIAQSGTNLTTPSYGDQVLFGLHNSGFTGFAGDYDALRIFTFGELDNPVAALNIPEPSSLALLGLGGLLAARRRR